MPPKRRSSSGRRRHSGESARKEAAAAEPLSTEDECAGSGGSDFEYESETAKMHLAQQKRWHDKYLPALNRELSRLKIDMPEPCRTLDGWGFRNCYFAAKGSITAEEFLSAYANFDSTECESE